MKTPMFVLALAVSLPAGAQQVLEDRPFLTFAAGVTSYDLSGTGSVPAGGVFVDYPLLSFLRLEGGAGLMRYEAQGGGPHATILFPEVGFRLEGQLSGVSPYVGGGFGTGIALEGGGNPELTLHGAAGARFLVAARLAVKGELRVRSVDPFTGTTADFLGGVAIRL